MSALAARARALLPSRGVLAAAAVGLALRLLVVRDLPTLPFSDFAAYFDMALRLATVGNLHGIAALHPPGYSLFLAPFLAITPLSLPVAKVVNCLLGAATVLAGARLARLLWGDKVALVAAWFVALYPRLLVQTAIVASENLFTPLLLLFVTALVAERREESALGRAAVVGALVGASALVRTVAYFLPAVWIGAEILRRRPFRLLARDLAVLLAVQHAVLLPWAMRNRADVGRFTFLTTTGGMGLFNGNNDDATGGWYRWQPQLERLRPDIRGRSAVYVDDVARQEALRWMRAHPARALALYGSKLGLIWKEDTLAVDWALTPPPRAYAPSFLIEHRRAARSVVRTAGLLAAAFGLAGCVLLLRRAARSAPERVVVAGYLGTMAAIPLISAWIAVNGRYRWPIEDLLLPLAAWAAATAAEAIAARYRVFRAASTARTT